MLLHFITGLFITFPFAMAMGTTNATRNIGQPGCPTQCGNVAVPYPFGFGDDQSCSLDELFHMTCNGSQLFLRTSDVRIHNISDTELRIFTDVSYRCYDQYGNVITSYNWVLWLKSFTFSEKNRFTVIGCDDYGLIKRENKLQGYSNGCIGLCNMNLTLDLPDKHCSGNGCCQTSIAKGLNYSEITLNTFNNHTSFWDINQCGYGFLGEEGSFQFGGVSDLSPNATDLTERVKSTVTVVLDWSIASDQNCSNPTECKENSSCFDVEGGGYHCRCNQGFQGNPYLLQGCQDVDECQEPKMHSCYGDCSNNVGSFTCTCPPGTSGNVNIQDGCRLDVKDSKFSTIIIIIVVTGGILALLSGIIGICYGIRRRKLMKLREKFFEQNGGELLKQKIKSLGPHEAMTLFSSQQLHKATDNYSQEKIVGLGGYGVVYKGVLSDKRVVAIKKSKLVDKSQAEQFINEVMILTQVIHRNVVKLLGCCLEEEVPVLVYEFISNNTLFYHIHNTLGGNSWLSWENRLRVASEAAGALGYLHSETTMPIIHRDVKSSNIMLDENYTTKISDFGASRLIPLDHNQVSTLIMGTLGYLDPEYFHTSQLTDKSDVYSFGVVLAELITGREPIGLNRSNDEKCLATFFVKAVKENRLFEIVEPRLLREGTLEKLQAVGELIKRCLSVQGCDRPTMKEVAMELEGLRKFTTHPLIQHHIGEDTQSLTLEVEQSELYDVPLISFSTNEWESYSGSTTMGFGENKPR